MIPMDTYQMPFYAIPFSMLFLSSMLWFNQYYVTGTTHSRRPTARQQIFSGDSWLLGKIARDTYPI